MSMKIIIIEADAEELRANRRVSDVIWDALEKFIGLESSSDTEEEGEADDK